MNQCVSVITVDGPSGAGKSILCKEISKNLNWNVLESGLIYRILALIILKNKHYKIKTNLLFLLQSLNFFNIIRDNSIKKNYFHFNFIKDIDSEKIANIASELACIPYIRESLLFKQRSFRQLPGLIADGRDMGTVVFPDACIKFFLKADLKTRVKRRFLNFQKKK
ncbi:MAG: (d)CMP kinase [Buchnera aphidicola (Meitanaphis microgallis)]